MRTVMGETVMEGPSDAGSIPASSTNMQNPNSMNSDSVRLTSLEHEVTNHIKEGSLGGR